MVKFWLLAACSLGFLSVASGAFGAHALKNVLDEYGRTIYDRAVLYQMFHALALFGVGVVQHLFRNRSFSLAGLGFLIGVVLFSGSLFVLAITRLRGLGAIPPLGGLFLSLWLDLLFHCPGKGTWLTRFPFVACFTLEGKVRRSST
jgi:uncharacterized membrane protein YgdD (TMEM256/DUF423 family)